MYPGVDISLFLNLLTCYSILHPFLTRIVVFLLIFTGMRSIFGSGGIPPSCSGIRKVFMTVLGFNQFYSNNVLKINIVHYGFPIVVCRHYFNTGRARIKCTFDRYAGQFSEESKKFLWSENPYTDKAIPNYIFFFANRYKFTYCHISLILMLLSKYIIHPSFTNQFSIRIF